MPRGEKNKGAVRPPRSRAGTSATTPETSIGRVSAVVAIGASAGGLEALEKFFDHVPDDSGHAWVVIQHLDPDFRSVMDELLARHSRLPIRKVESGMPVEPNMIYLNPARHDMTIDQGAFQVRPSAKTGGLNLPINFFFESAASEFGEQAIGVILSGTGSDGTKGCEAIKEAGGLVFVQEPSSAKFDSMPASVLAKDLADGMDRPENLPALVLGAKVSYRQKPNRPAEMDDADPYAPIFSIVKARYDIDFSVYKTTTMERRIKRRMGIVACDGLMDYTDMLAINRDEVAFLLKDLLLDVTAFFRDRDAFKILTEKVIGPLVDRMSDSREVRVWVAGCSSGEEAYSIAITFADLAAARGKPLNIKILATDIHLSSLAIASAGLYPEDSMAAVPPDIVERHFDREGDNLRIKKAIRRLIVFSQHNLLKDPPFARIDLLTCRNVLIYFKEDAQKYALNLFHFSLIKGGVVFLGPSETLGQLDDEFNAVHQKWRIFTKTRDNRLLGPGMLMTRHGSQGTGGLGRPHDAANIRGAGASSSRDVLRATNGALRELLARYAPPGFLIGRDGTLMHVFGDATKYLTLKPGVFSQKIIDLLPREIALLVANGLGGGNRDSFTRYRRSIRRMTDRGEKLEVVTIEQMSEGEADSDYLLLTIDSREAVLPSKETGATEDSTKSLDETLDLRRVNEELRVDLQSTEENLQSAIEELATSNEELQSTNEELMASNEELQSTNEELHSVNEELYTVGAEHQRKIEELMQLTLDMEYLLKATEIGTIFLDEKMYVRRFTPAASIAFNLIPQDVGRPITHITFRFERVDFLSLLDEVSVTREVREQEISVDGRAYLLRILPYRADGADLLGAVVTLIDVGALKKAQAQVRELDRRNQAVLAALTESIVSWDAATETVLFCNEVFAATLDAQASDLIGSRLCDVMGAERYAIPRSAMDELATTRSVEHNVLFRKANGEAVWQSIVFTHIAAEDGTTFAYLACGRDISEQMRYVRALEKFSLLEMPIGEPVEVFVRAALEIGTGFLGMPYALLSETVGEHHRIVTRVGNGLPALEEGTSVHLPHDLCERTCEVAKSGLCLFKSAVGLRIPGLVSTGEADGDNSAYEQMCELVLAGTQLAARSPDDRPVQVADMSADLATYVGMRIRASGTTWGTVSFFSHEAPNFGPLSELQRGFVRQLAQWIGLKLDAHRQHRALQQSEAELRLMFDSVPQDIWHVDSRGSVRRANAAAAGKVRRSVDEVVGISVDDVLPAIDPQWRDKNREVLESRTPLYGEVERSIDADGNPQWISTDRIPHLDRATGERSMLIVASDITALKQREAELQTLNQELERNHRRFEQLYRQTPVMMCSFGRDGRLLEASDLWLIRTGFAREDVIGRELVDFLHPDSRDVATEMVLPPLWRDGSCRAVPLVVIGKDKTPIEVELSGFLYHEYGEKPSCLAVLVEVTERNDAGRALEQANRELASANDGLKKFAHVASHDLQEPLRKISQFGDLLTKEFGETLDDDGRFYVEVMRDSADRMRQLIRDILTFSKSVNAVIERGALPLADLVGDLIVELDVTVREAGAAIEVAALPTVIGDRTAVQLLFRNLLSNSLKYRREGVDPRISIDGRWNGTNTFAIHIRDNGCGFDQRYRESIFDPFTRLHTRHEVGGTGIGLAICKSVCERHHWAISAGGAPGEGAEFVIVIPAAAVVEGESGRHA